MMVTQMGMSQKLGQVAWTIGLTMGVAQFAGSQLGARAAMANGARLIRPLLVVVCSALALRLALQPDHPLRGLFMVLWPF